MALGGIGSQLSQPPATLLNTSNAITQKYFLPRLVDAVFLPSPFFWRTTRFGKQMEGGALVWPVINQEESTGGAFWGTQLLATDTLDSIQPAELQWRLYYQSCVIPMVDIMLNQGFAGVVNIVHAKETVTFGSLLMKLSRGMQRTSPQNTSIDIDGVPLALASSGTYAGIPIGVNSTTGFTWESNGGAGPTNAAVNSGKGAAWFLPAATASSITASGLQQEYGACSFGNEEPTLILTTQAGYNNFLTSILLSQQRYIDDAETTRAGFRNVMYNRAAYMHDQFVPTGEIQFYTEKYVRPVFHPGAHFVMRPFVMPSTQEALIGRVVVAIQLQFLQLRCHGRVTGNAAA